MEVLLHSPAFLAIVAICVLAEAAWRWRSGRGVDLPGALASFGVAAGNLLLKPLSALLIGGFYGWLLRFSAQPLRLDDWRVWVVGFVAVEFAYYWFHRWSHTVRWLWASHAVHHSATELSFPAALRLGWTAVLSLGWVVYAPLILIGFPPILIASLLSANLAYQFFLHTEAIGRLGAAEWLLNTPASHRVHHASNSIYLDSNFGGVLIVFDRLFGTFVAERADVVPRYGLATGFTACNPITIVCHEWRAIARDVSAARDARAVWRALFGRP